MDLALVAEEADALDERLDLGRRGLGVSAGVGAKTRAWP
jgi:hypothetical protein